MDSDQLDFTVDAVSRVHPMSIVINLLFIGVLLSGLYGLFFDNKALYGVLIYIFVGFVVRLVFCRLLKAYLRSKYKKLLQSNSDD
ncbi:hypothetical protein VR7878_01540 [Vibrio ruber DSM 16370]|uniref:Uncharacterized protein n=1 Tax=Vibrio ruber (strain DSM 16370 / JCM 11486 / BCRC 17186 / CECT 7878 / LMG 23124 / VR1) TaxID=1123498 RepID=A0A1R4LI22_VIBR1|nr:hypothetical protein VR7878_01540 [Vibrio ruber DSM 16370]